MENEKSVENKGEHTTRWRIVKTVFLVLVWVCLGLFLEITGPTLIDLKLQTHSDYEAVASAVSGRSAGFFIGSALGGVLVDKFGLYCDLMLALCLDCGAIFTVVVPWVSSTDLLFFFTLSQGLFEGIINVSGQKLILNMWKENAASPLHILHGGFGIGSFIIPLIANPFLAEIIEANDNTSVVNNETAVTILPSTTTTEGPIEYKKESRIEYAYIIAAAITVAVSLIFFGYHFMGYKERQQKRIETNGGSIQRKGDITDNETINDAKTLSFKEMFNPATCAGGRFVYGLVILALVFLFFIQAVGGERVGGKFIRAFAIDHFKFSNDDASYLNTAFWIAFSVGRVAGFVVARWIPIRILILIETGGVLLTSILLVIFGGETQLALWVLMCIMGFFIAPLFPSGMGWANFHVDVTGVAITIFMLGGSLGGVIYMNIIGFLYEHYGTHMFLYTLLGYGLAAFTLAVLMDIIGAQHGSRFKDDKKTQKTNVVITGQNTNATVTGQDTKF